MNPDAAAASAAQQQTALPRAFRWFWAGEAVSGWGSYITVVAVQSLVILTLGGGATQSGLLTAARWLPYLLFGLLVGALVDRARRRPVMIGSDLARAGLLLALPLLWFQGWLNFATLLLVMVAFGLASVINDASSMAFLSRLVPAAGLQRAHARLDGTDAAAQISAPAAAGALVAAIGAPLAVIVDAITYLFSAVVAATIRVCDPRPQITTHTSLASDIGEGLSEVYRGRLAPLAAATLVWFGAHAIVGAIFAPLVLTRMGLGPQWLGVALSAGGVGALIGASITTAVGRRIGSAATIVGCHLGSALAITVMALSLTVLPNTPSVANRSWTEFSPAQAAALALVVAGQVLHGVAMGASNSHEMSIRQGLTPDHLQARVNITMRSFNRSVLVIAAPLGGLLADRAGMGWALSLAAVIFATSAAVLLFSRFRAEPSPG